MANFFQIIYWNISFFNAVIFCSQLKSVFFPPQIKEKTNRNQKQYFKSSLWQQPAKSRLCPHKQIFLKTAFFCFVIGSIQVTGNQGATPSQHRCCLCWYEEKWALLKCFCFNIYRDAVLTLTRQMLLILTWLVTHDHLGLRLPWLQQMLKPTKLLSNRIWPKWLNTPQTEI